jgi:hypothetical protein
LPKPQRRPLRLDCLVDDRQQFGRRRGQVDLVVESSAKRLNGPGRVILAAVEAPIHHCLDAAAGGWNRAATARVAPATAQFGVSPADTAIHLPQDKNGAGVDGGQ